MAAQGVGSDEQPARSCNSMQPNSSDSTPGIVCEAVDEEMLKAATRAALEWGQEALCKASAAEDTDPACTNSCREDAGDPCDIAVDNVDLETAALVAIQWGQEAVSQQLVIKKVAESPLEGDLEAAALDAIQWGQEALCPRLDATESLHSASPEASKAMTLDCEDGEAHSAETTAGAEEACESPSESGEVEEQGAGDSVATLADSGRSGSAGDCQGSASSFPAQPVADRAAHRLRAQVAELEARLALHGERQVRECREAARREATALEWRFGAQIADALSLERRLEAEAAQKEQEAKRKDRRILEVERLLRNTEQRIQQLSRSSLEGDAADSQGAEDEAEVERVKSQQQAELDGLQAELQTVREQSSATTAEMQQALDDEKLRVESLRARAKELARVSEAGEQLRRQLQLSDERAAEMETSSEMLHHVLNRSETRVEELREQSAALSQAAERGEGSLRADLAVSVARERELEAQFNELTQADDESERLQEQLDSSNDLVAGMEAALISLQTQLQDLQEREAAAIPWRQERDELRSELIALHAAEEAAHDRVAELQSEIDSLRAQRSSAAAEGLEGTCDGLATENYSQRADGEAAVVRQVSEVEQAKSSLQDARARLDARERRVQLLARRFAAGSRPEQPAETSVPPAQLQEKLQEATQRVVDLEDIMADHSTRLDRCRKQRVDLLRWRQRAERMGQDRSRRELEIAQDQQKRHLQSALASAARKASSKGSGMQGKRECESSPSPTTADDTGSEAFFENGQKWSYGARWSSQDTSWHNQWTADWSSSTWSRGGW